MTSNHWTLLEPQGNSERIKLCTVYTRKLTDFREVLKLDKCLIRSSTSPDYIGVQIPAKDFSLPQELPLG
jgi:hypothetical protein